MPRLPTIIPAILKPTVFRTPAANRALGELGWIYAPVVAPAEVDAHPDRGYRVLCGRGLRGDDPRPRCPGLIGFARSYHARPDPNIRVEQAAKLAGDESYLSDAWFVVHANGLQRQLDGHYRPIAKEFGRRPLPQALRAFDGDAHYGIIGDLAKIPCVIACPGCHVRNKVVLPEDADAWFFSDG